jgi:hypothetical protein
MLPDQPPLALFVAGVERAHCGELPAAFSFDASTVPRYCPRFLMIETRQLRSLVTVGLFLAFFIGFARPLVSQNIRCAGLHFSAYRTDIRRLPVFASVAVEVASTSPVTRSMLPKIILPGLAAGALFSRRLLKRRRQL